MIGDIEVVIIEKGSNILVNKSSGMKYVFLRDKILKNFRLRPPKSSHNSGWFDDSRCFCMMRRDRKTILCREDL